MGKFAVKKTKSGIKFNLKARNGEIIASSEVYNSKASCLKGIESVRKNAPIAALEDQTVEGFEQQKHPKFEIYTDKAGEFRFRLKARNGRLPERRRVRAEERRGFRDRRGGESGVNLKEKIEELVSKIRNDSGLLEQFKKDPVKAVEGLLGVDLPEDTVKQIADSVKVKLAGDNLAGAVDKLKDLFGK